MANQSFVLPQPWSEVKEKIKEHNIELTDEDLQYERGGEEALLTHLQQKLGKTREELIGLIESIASNAGKAN